MSISFNYGYIFFLPLPTPSTHYQFDCVDAAIRWLVAVE